VATGPVGAFSNLAMPKAFEAAKLIMGNYADSIGPRANWAQSDAPYGCNGNQRDDPPVRF
jgi:hypothetical protein